MVGVWRALLLVSLLAAGPISHPTEVVVELIGKEGELPAGWRPLTFRGVPTPTHYTLVRDGGELVLRAESRSGASGLLFPLDVDPEVLPVVRWRWRVENLLEGADIATKAGDDYPARFYVLFEPDPSRLGLARRLLWRAMRLVYGETPTHGLVYLFASHAKPGQIYDNPYAPTLKMVVVQSGPENVGRWLTEQRSVVEDYRRAFGDSPPRIIAVAYMTDSDDTDEEAVAYYGPVRFLPAQG